MSETRKRRTGLNDGRTFWLWLTGRWERLGVSGTAGEHIDVAEDRDGNRYTTHAFAGDDDPWRGALILSPRVVADLRDRGMLPLALVRPEAGA